MGSYVTGAVIAVGMLFGLIATHEMSTGNSIYGQNQLASLSEDELRVLAEEFSSPDQVDAILELGRRPGELEKTVPVLAELSISWIPLIKLSAETSLQEIGDDAAEHLREFIDQNTTYGYRVSCSAMRAIGPACKIYMPELKRLLEDDILLHRKCGLYALQGMGIEGKEALQQIIVCVLDRDLNTQCSACRVLETFGPEAIEAKESLLTLQKKGGPNSRGWAAICLGSIGPTSSDVPIAETLAKQLAPGPGARSVPRIEQQRILTGLAHLGPDATEVVDVVREKLNGNNKFVRAHAAYALWCITGNEKESLNVLRELLNDPDPDPNHRKNGFDVIGMMGAEDIAFAAEAAPWLRSPEATTRKLAVDAIGNMGPAAKLYESRIRERLADTDPNVRVAAKKALVNMGR